MAERLHYTIEYLESMPFTQYKEWIQYFKQLSDLEKQEEEAAKGNMLARNNPDDFLKGFKL